MAVRKSTLAGSWYPGSAAGCEKEIRKFVKDPGIRPPSGTSPVAGIVPHAGWYFSGAIACNVIRYLADDPPPDVFIIFGMHLHPGSPCFLMAEGLWDTPLGTLPVDADLAAALAGRFDFQIETAARYTPENTIELQLPFVKYFSDATAIVPVGVPPDERSLEIGMAAAQMALEQGKKPAVLGSTDLTHYGANYGFMPQGSGPGAIDWVRNENDRRLIDALSAMAPEAVLREAATHQNACCAGAAAAAVAAAKTLGACQAETIAYANSYDKSPGDSFVGYVGMVLGP